MSSSWGGRFLVPGVGGVYLLGAAGGRTDVSELQGLVEGEREAVSGHGGDVARLRLPGVEPGGGDDHLVPRLTHKHTKIRLKPTNNQVRPTDKRSDQHTNKEIKGKPTDSILLTANYSIIKPLTSKHFHKISYRNN